MLNLEKFLPPWNAPVLRMNHTLVFSLIYNTNLHELEKNNKNPLA
ncbi:Uncharacterised protein [Streptococcus pneumoniae]|nr:Uncharacterised protein [Streptococcus pneumoniae]CKI20683.1 Uncharacterised protein [Streptococcus pneumoniae]